MGGEARTGDVVGFYAAAIEETVEVSSTGGGVVNAGHQTVAQGALREGRWLVQLRSDSAEDYAWVNVGRFTDAATLAGVGMGEGRKRFPLSNRALIAVELIVRKGVNDRVAVVSELAAATVYLTRVSHDR